MKLLVSVSVLILASAAIPSHEIKSLPGWDAPLKSKQFSGLIATGNETGVPGKLHYWLIEAEEEPDKAPLVMWYNGGPGSSSLIGLLTENGQVELRDESLTTAAYNRTGVPTLFYNPHSWSKAANVLFLEQPKGVGFSYCDAAKAALAAGSTRAAAAKLCPNDDNSTAVDAHEFLLGFFQAYPEYRDRDFYITGESYAGTYIPMLMDQILARGQVPNFRGAAIGNGCWGSDCFYGMTEPQIDFHIFEGHALIPQSLKSQIELACTDFSDPSAECERLLDKSQRLPGAFNVYNIYDLCNGDDMARHFTPANGSSSSSSSAADVGAGVGAGRGSPGRLARLREAVRAGNKPLRLIHATDALRPHPALTGALNDYACGMEEAMGAWLRAPGVADALHVDPLGAQGGMQYDANVGDITGTYEKLLGKYRLLIYSGDVDACVPYWGTERFTRAIGGEEQGEWHAWTSESVAGKGRVVAGYATTYKDFQFITVKGAGHEVPRYRPVAALTMLRKFLKNETF